MAITQARWQDAEHTAIACLLDDAPASIPVGHWLLDGFDGEIAEYVAPGEGPDPVPASVTNFQARYVMRQTPMPDGRSLFTTVDTALREAVYATRERPEFDEARVEADVNWQAWEQANEYLRDGSMVTMLADRFRFDADRTDALFRAAAQVRI